MTDLQQILNNAKAKNFQVVEFVTTQTMEITLPNTARILKAQNFAGQATLKRGKKFYTANVRKDNTIAKALYVASE
jgi:hypothetical protein